MKIGDYVTVQNIANQETLRWVVLKNLDFNDEGDIKGGVIGFISNSRIEAANASVAMDISGDTTLLVSGATDTLTVGGVLIYDPA